MSHEVGSTRPVHPELGLDRRVSRLVQAVRPPRADRWPVHPVRRGVGRRWPVRQRGRAAEGRGHQHQPLDGPGDAGTGAAVLAVVAGAAAEGEPAGAGLTGGDRGPVRPITSAPYDAAVTMFDVGALTTM